SSRASAARRASPAAVTAAPTGVSGGMRLRVPGGPGAGVRRLASVPAWSLRLVTGPPGGLLPGAPGGLRAVAARGAWPGAARGAHGGEPQVDGPAEVVGRCGGGAVGSWLGAGRHGFLLAGRRRGGRSGAAVCYPEDAGKARGRESGKCPRLWRPGV